MTLEEALRARLIADPAVAAIVGTRIYPVILPQGVTYPAVTYEGISSTPLFSLRGSSGLEHQRIQIDAWALMYLDALELAAAIKAAINGLSWTAEGIEVQGAFLLTYGDHYEEEVAIYRRTADFRLSYVVTAVA